MKAFFTAAMLTVAAAAHAEAWTLDSCISYATEHNISVLISDNSRRSAEQGVADARSRYLPNVSASASQDFNLGRGLTAENTYANRNTSSFNWGVGLNVPVFDGLATPRRIAYARDALSQIVERYEAAKENVTINVITAYLQALYTQELNQVAKHQVELSAYDLERQQALLEAGKIPEVDIYDARAQLAADELNVVQTANDMLLARFDLMQLLRLQGDPAEFETMPLPAETGIIPKPAAVYRSAMANNHTIRAARLGVDAAESNIKVAQTGYLPTLSFSARIGSQYYNVSGMPNENFGGQMRHNFSTYFGLSLQVPIFDAFSTRNAVRRAKIEKTDAELQLQQSSEELERTVQQAYYQAVGAQEKLRQSTVADEAAQRVFEAMQEKYNIGRATPLEYQQAKAKALKATADRIQAGYELVLRTRLLNFYAGN